MGITTFPSDNTRIAEMEFYLLEELDFHLIIFHPYRSLVQLCGRDGGPEAGGTEGQEQRLKMLQMDDTALQMAWFVLSTSPSLAKTDLFPQVRDQRHLSLLAFSHSSATPHRPRRDLPCFLHASPRT